MYSGSYYSSLGPGLVHRLPRDTAQRTSTGIPPSRSYTPVGSSRFSTTNSAYGASSSLSGGLNAPRSGYGREPTSSMLPRADTYGATFSPHQMTPSTPRGGSSGISSTSLYGGNRVSGTSLAAAPSFSTGVQNARRDFSSYHHGSSIGTGYDENSSSTQDVHWNVGATSSTLRTRNAEPSWSRPQPPPSLSPHTSALHPHSLAHRSSNFETKPQGLRNLGNTCYLNSTLQCMLHAHGFLYQLRKELDTVNNSRSRSTRLASDLLGLCSKDQAAERGVLLRAVLRAAADINPQFQNVMHQHDAHEFLRALLLALHNSMNRTKGAYREMKDIPGESDAKAASRWIQYLREHDNSLVYDLFGGFMKLETVCCHCFHRSLSFDPFLDLSVPVPRYEDGLEMLLTRFTSVERLEGTDRFFCPRCKTARDADRRITVESWPKLLVVHLKRFNHRGVKNNAPVRFSDNLAVQPQWSAADNARDECGRPINFHDVASLPRYALTGVACHSGTSTCGHYFAHVKTERGQWYFCDDSSIRESDGREAVMDSSNAYLLFYVKQ